MKRKVRRLLAAPCALALAGCALFESNRYQIAAGGAGGPAAVFKMDTATGELWYAWWDPAESRYRWRRVDTGEPETTKAPETKSP